MEISDYLVFVADKLQDAQNKGDKTEWIRLATVLISTIALKIIELETGEK